MNVNSMLAPVKKVSISNFAVEAIVRDIGLLHNVYFDQSNFIENEAKFFIKEFESKRGDRDLQCLRQCAELLGSTNAIIDNSSMLSNKFLDEITAKVRETSEVITLQMPKEQLHHEQRSIERRLHVATEDEEKHAAEQQALQRRVVIDHNFQAHSQMFREKYAIVTDPSAPGSASNSSSLLPTTSSADSSTSLLPTTPATLSVEQVQEAQPETSPMVASEALMFAR